MTGVTAALSSAAAEAVAFSVESAHQRGVTVSLDVNFRSRLWPEAAARKALRPLLPSVDILFASEDELMLVGTLTIPAQPWAAGDILSLQFHTGGGDLIDEYNLPLDASAQPQFPGMGRQYASSI